MNYLRTSNEQCNLYKLKKNRRDASYYPNIKYGDIIYEENGYRAINSYVYTGDFKCLSDMGPGNGSGGISESISKNIEDPINFYKDANCVCDLAEIKLDTIAHMPVLRREAGDRDICDKFEFYYDCINNQITFESAKLCDGTTKTLVLSTDLDDYYLTGKEFTETDPLEIREKKKNMELYEKNSPNVLVIGNNIYYNLECKNSSGGGFIKIIDIKYDDNNKPIEVITEHKYNLGIYGIEQTIFKFIPIDKHDGDMPTWTCLDINIESDYEMFDYDEHDKKHKFSLTFSKYSFRDKF